MYILYQALHKDVKSLGTCSWDLPAKRTWRSITRGRRTTLTPPVDDPRLHEVRLTSQVWGWPHLTTSSRMMSAQLKSTIHRIVRLELGLYPYKLQIKQSLTDYECAWQLDHWVRWPHNLSAHGQCLTSPYSWSQSSWLISIGLSKGICLQGFGTVEGQHLHSCQEHSKWGFCRMWLWTSIKGWKSWSSLKDATWSTCNELFLCYEFGECMT